ncbi:MAG: RteC domain-containing protein [Flavobacterium sp.]|nr:RteC domain-containing protein [Flavobacterium sp.]
MDFYNFEKYNDVFCFKKLENDYQPLLKTYTDNYQTSMNTFLKEYGENTEFRFIESQLYFCNEEIKTQKSIITSLKKLDYETFYYVRNRISEKYFVYLKKIGFQDDELDTDLKDKNTNNDEPNELKSSTIINFTNDEDEDDEDLLNMHATAENFIKFISNRITSLCLINEFLEQRKQKLERELTTILPTDPSPENLLKWNGTQTEFIELIKALIENGNIKGTQTQIISKLSNVFNIVIKHPNKLITDIKKRNNGSETLFLDKLQKSLLDYIAQEKKK